MIKAEDVLSMLDRYRELMTTLSGRQLGGFALVYPPEGDPVEIVLLTSQNDEKSFFKLVAEKCISSKDQHAQSQGFVATPYAGRR